MAAFWERGVTRPLRDSRVSGCDKATLSAQVSALIVISKPTFFIKPLHALLLVLVAWAAIYLPGLGKRELQGEEARRVLPGRTMLQTGDWVVPRSAGEVYNRKPPGINWATAIAMVVTGRMDEKSVRMPSALAMLALAMVTLVVMRGFLGMEGALLAALIMLTNLGFIERGRLAEIDGLYCALFGMAALSWLSLWWQERPMAAWLLSGWLLGLAFLVKGPPHVWFFYAMVIGVLRQEKRLRELLTWRHGLGLVIFVLTWSWWAYLNAGTNPDKDSSSVWIDQIASRLGLSDFHLVSWLLLIPKSLGAFLPWALLLPLGIRILQARNQASDEQSRHTRILIGVGQGLLVGFLFIALLPSSRPRFLLPLNAVAAVFLVGCLRLLAEDSLRQIQQKWTRGMTLLAILGTVGLAATPIIAITGKNPESAMPLITVVTMCIAASVISIILIGWRTEWVRSLTGTLPMLGVSTAVAAMVTLLTYSQLLTAGIVPERLKPFAAEVRKITGVDSDILLFRVPERMWPFYLGFGCREIAEPKELPEKVSWVMTPADKRDKNFVHLLREYGEPLSEQRIREPLTDDAGGKGIELVLWQFR